MPSGVAPVWRCCGRYRGSNGRGNAGLVRRRGVVLLGELRGGKAGLGTAHAGPGQVQEGDPAAGADQRTAARGIAGGVETRHGRRAAAVEQAHAGAGRDGAVEAGEPLARLIERINAGALHAAPDQGKVPLPLLAGGGRNTGEVVADRAAAGAHFPGHRARDEVRRRRVARRVAMDERLAVLVDEPATNRRQEALPVRIGVAIGGHVAVAELHAHQLGANVPRQLVRLAADHVVAEVCAAPATPRGREHHGLGADDRDALFLAAQGDGTHHPPVIDQQVGHDRLVQRLGLAPPDSHLPHELHQLGAIESHPRDGMPPMDLAAATDELPIRVTTGMGPPQATISRRRS